MLTPTISKPSRGATKQCCSLDDSPISTGIPTKAQWPMPGYRRQNNQAQYSNMVTPQPLFAIPVSRRRRRWVACQQSNNEDCIRSYRCCSNKHFKANCRMRGVLQVRGNPLNGRGSLQWDREGLVPNVWYTVVRKRILWNSDTVHHGTIRCTVPQPARLNSGLLIG